MAAKRPHTYDSLRDIRTASGRIICESVLDQQLKTVKIRTSRPSRKMMLAGEEVEEERQNEVGDIS
jgi:hypothetical protein